MTNASMLVTALPERAETYNLTLFNLCGDSDVDWQKWLKAIMVPIIALLGLAGNILSFRVMSSPVYSHKSYSVYLRALAVSDSLLLIVALIITGDEICRDFGGYQTCYLPIILPATWACKLWEWLRHTIYVVSSWLIVAFTVDRYLAVCHPLRLPRMCTEWRAAAAVATVWFFSAFSQIFRLVFIERLDKRGQPCHAPRDARVEYYAWHYFGFSTTLRFLLPFVIIAICNGLIIFHIWRLHHRRNHEARNSRTSFDPHGSDIGRSRTANMAVTTLFAVCAVFNLTLLPNALISLTLYAHFQTNAQNLDSLGLFCALRALDVPFQILRLTNYSINMVLYGLTGRRFRRELARLVCGHQTVYKSGNVVRFTPLERRQQSPFL